MPFCAKSADFFRPPAAADDFLPENHGKLEIFPAAYGGEQNFQVEITMESKIGPEKRAADENFARSPFALKVSLLSAALKVSLLRDPKVHPML